MAYEFKEGQISLFRNNDKKETTHPDFKGKCMINGQIMYVSLWVKTSDNGTSWMGGTIQPPKNAQSQPAPPAAVDDMLTRTPVRDTENSPLLNDDPVEQHEFDSPPLREMDSLPF